MRVLVAAEGCGLAAGQTSAVIAGAFADAGAEVAVTPLAGGGLEFAALLREIDPQLRLAAPTSLAKTVEALNFPPDYLDLTSTAVPELASLWRLARPSAAAGLVALVSAESRDLPLTGLSGLVAETGRRAGLELAQTLELNSQAEHWLAKLGIDDASGAGAAGGLGALVFAAGGRVTTAWEACADAHGIAATMAQADLVVGAATQLDFHEVGGPGIRLLAELAARALRPLVVIAGRSFISARELRLSGIEEAHPVLGDRGQQITVDALTSTAKRVARTWVPPQSS